MSNVWSLQPLLLAVSICFWVGCAAPSKATRESEDNTKEFLEKYEKTFTPADYDIDVAIVRSEEKKEFSKGEQVRPAPRTEELEIVPGFRIQVSFSEDIERANQLRDELSSKLPEEWVYVVFEAPYYKVRVGNFLTRPDANATLRTLVSVGYKDAWIVPDRVYKEPPLKPVASPDELNEEE